MLSLNFLLILSIQGGGIGVFVRPFTTFVTRVHAVTIVRGGTVTAAIIVSTTQTPEIFKIGLNGCFDRKWGCNESSRSRSHCGRVDQECPTRECIGLARNRRQVIVLGSHVLQLAHGRSPCYFVGLKRNSNRGPLCCACFRRKCRSDGYQRSRTRDGGSHTTMFRSMTNRTTRGVPARGDIVTAQGLISVQS
eukprot:scaffold1999_cov153-Amphora_coffeaeformis.AAC.20